MTVKQVLPEVTIRSDSVDIEKKADNIKVLLLWWLIAETPCRNYGILLDLRLILVHCFFFKGFWRTHVLFWGHWYPCFGFLVTSPLGFKARVGSALF